MTETILVTGASGFLGQWLIKALGEKGFDVIGVDLNPGEKGKAQILKADFTDSADLKYISETIKGNCYLVHLGAYILKSSNQEDQYDIQRSTQTNVVGSLNLVKILKDKLTGICLASTLDVYGDPKGVIIDENQPIEPQTNYAKSKAEMESVVQKEVKDAIPLSILRFSHIYGPGDPHPKALQSFIETVCFDKNPVIYGDGLDQRDYIYVSDVGEAILKTIEIKPKGIFNVAAGESHSLKELAELAINASGKDLRVVFKERKSPRRDYNFNVSKINKELDFFPKVSVKEGIISLVQG